MVDKMEPLPLKFRTSGEGQDAPDGTHRRFILLSKMSRFSHVSLHLTPVNMSIAAIGMNKPEPSTLDPTIVRQRKAVSGISANSAQKARLRMNFRENTRDWDKIITSSIVERSAVEGGTVLIPIS